MNDLKTKIYYLAKYDEIILITPILGDDLMTYPDNDEIHHDWLGFDITEDEYCTYICDL